MTSNIEAVWIVTFETRKIETFAFLENPEPEKLKEFFGDHFFMIEKIPIFPTSL
tara:strand:- start:549 stop:710 length:162 start_codon:yes stop_codon:yes gene_type:complete